VHLLEPPRDAHPRRLPHAGQRRAVERDDLAAGDLPGERADDEDSAERPACEAERKHRPRVLDEEPDELGLAADPPAEPDEHEPDREPAAAWADRHDDAVVGGSNRDAPHAPIIVGTVQPYLQTERLTLRALTAADAENLFELDADPAVMRFINGGKPTPREVIENETLPRLLAEYGDGYGVWAAVERSTGTFIGWFSLRSHERDRAKVELGYRLRRSAWGKGYATEGSQALVDKGFSELGAERIVATTMTVNTASRRVMEKVGLEYVRTFHETWPESIEGTEEGDMEYALTRSGWERRRGGTPTPSG
jgi:RimJ/RimL family protein N-acetyltransferase